MIFGATNAISLCATEEAITGAASTPPHSHRHCVWRRGWGGRRVMKVRSRGGKGGEGGQHTPTGTAHGVDMWEGRGAWGS